MQLWHQPHVSPVSLFLTSGFFISFMVKIIYKTIINFKILSWYVKLLQWRLLPSVYGLTFALCCINVWYCCWFGTLFINRCLVETTHFYIDIHKFIVIQLLGRKVSDSWAPGIFSRWYRELWLLVASLQSVDSLLAFCITNYLSSIIYKGLASCITNYLSSTIYKGLASLSLVSYTRDWHLCL